MYKNKQVTDKTGRVDQLNSADTLNPAGIGRRSFMKRLGVAGAAALPAGALLTSQTQALADDRGTGLSNGDTAILKFLAAAQNLETDLWPPYNELPLRNAAFPIALTFLDGELPTSLNHNTADEFFQKH